MYASLLPFEGWRAPPPEVFGFLGAPWPRYVTAGDVMLNIVAYLPLGAMLFTSLRPPLSPAAAEVSATAAPVPAPITVTRNATTATLTSGATNLVDEKMVRIDLLLTWTDGRVPVARSLGLSSIVARK